MRKSPPLERLRKIALALPGATEKLSHGEPTFFVKNRVFAMYSSDHHHDGHIAAIVPAPPGVQETLAASEPKKFYRPPYVGGKGWLGIELGEVDDDELGAHLTEAWRMMTRKK